MPRSVLFIDLAGTLVVRDPQSRRVVAWTGVAGLMFELSREHELHLTTGDSEQGAHDTLAALEIAEYFTGVHAGLTGGGKPFGALARVLAIAPERCLVIGDDPVNDTAGDSDRVVSLILRHETAQVATARVREIVTTLANDSGFLGGFEACRGADHPADLSPDDWPSSTLGDDVRLGHWQKTERARRPIVILTA